MQVIFPSDVHVMQGKNHCHAGKETLCYEDHTKHSGMGSVLDGAATDQNINGGSMVDILGLKAEEFCFVVIQFMDI